MRIFLIGLGEGLARSLERYLSSDPSVALAGVAANIALAEVMLPTTGPALALVEWSALGDSPGDSVRALRRNRPGLRVVCVVSDPYAYTSAGAGVGADAVVVSDQLAVELELLLRDPLESVPVASIGSRDHD